MSMYKYPNWHEIKDLVMIYKEWEWDNAEVKVWDPVRQKHMRLTFTGSERPHDGEIGKIHFNVYDIDEQKAED